jgi:hypothetical protein
LKILLNCYRDTLSVDAYKNTPAIIKSAMQGILTLATFDLPRNRLSGSRSVVTGGVGAGLGSSS